MHLGGVRHRVAGVQEGLPEDLYVEDLYLYDVVPLGGTVDFLFVKYLRKGLKL